jgi:hypothetical protein
LLGFVGLFLFLRPVAVLRTEASSRSIVAALGRQKALPDGGIEGQMAMLLQRGDEAGQYRLEALAADPVRGFPQDDEGCSHRLTVDPSSNHGSAPYGGTGASQQTDGVLAMTPGYGDELVQYFGFVHLGSLQVTLPKRCK